MSLLLCNRDLNNDVREGGREKRWFNTIKNNESNNDNNNINNTPSITTTTTTTTTTGKRKWFM